jgi:hypothetical protein
LVGKELKLGMPGTDAALAHTILHTHTACFKSISKVHDRNATQMQQVGAADFPPKITNPNIIDGIAFMSVYYTYRLAQADVC